MGAAFCYRQLILFALAFTPLASTVTSARAYTVGSGFSFSCHEPMTVASGLILFTDAFDAPLPESEDWLRVADSLRPGIVRGLRQLELPEGSADALNDPVTNAEAFALFSATVGVRVADTEGHALSDLNTIRRIHADPDPQGQYAHALRGAGDDGLQGDLAAIAGIKAALRSLFAEIREVARSAPDAQIVKAPLYLDHYGTIEVDVLRGPFLFGRIAHTLQDSFSHTLRSPDGRHVMHVMNYVEAISGELQSERDGLAHSESLDDCRAPVGVLVRGAVDVTAQAARALQAYVAGDESLLEAGLSPCPDDAAEGSVCGWLTYNPSCERQLKADEAPTACCTGANNYCDSPWLELAQEEPSEPYLDPILCTVTAPGSPSRSAPSLWLLPIALLVLRRRHREAIAPIARGMLILAAIALASPRPAHADAPPQEHDGPPIAPPSPVALALELHGSALSDVPERSVLALTVGYGVRGAYRFESQPWGRWGLLLQVERSLWFSNELDIRFNSGVLNVGLGAEGLFYDGLLHVSAVVGTSTLTFDAALHDAGSTGYFVEVRPVGLHWVLGERVAVTFTPLALAVAAPGLTGPYVLRQHSYRTVLGLEWLP